MDTNDLSPLAGLLRAALASGKRLVFVQVQFVYADGAVEAHTLSGSIVPVDVSGREATSSGDLTEMEKTVLGILARAEKPLKGSAIATRAGVRNSSHIRGTLSELVRRGKLIHAPQGGYWPADRKLPAE